MKYREIAEFRSRLENVSNVTETAKGNLPWNIISLRLQVMRQIQSHGHIQVPRSNQKKNLTVKFRQHRHMNIFNDETISILVKYVNIHIHIFRGREMKV